MWISKKEYTKLAEVYDCLVKKYQELQSKQTELRETAEKILDRITLLENPPKHKAGDRLSKDIIVLSVDVVRGQYVGILMYYKYTLFNEKTKEIKIMEQPIKNYAENKI